MLRVLRLFGAAGACLKNKRFTRRFESYSLVKTSFGAQKRQGQVRVSVFVRFG